MNDERFLELLQESLLDGLPPEEERALAEELERRGLAGQRFRRELVETLGALALDAGTAPPPDRLRSRVLAATEDPAGVRPATALPRKRPWLPWAATGIAAALALSLGVSNLRLRERADRLAAEVEEARRGLAAADSAAVRLADLQSDLDLLSGPGSSVHALAGTGPAPDSRARVFLDPATGRALLFAYDLPLLQPGDVYELWAIRDGVPRAAGAFRPGADGRARLEVADRALLEDVDALAVTVEPAPGAEAPTGDMVLISSS
ncbi:MAG TPA: anti-sigma factor [Gemmatimonadota bacterium]|nr:anti-sigma factor [Gemmatimonadota bacterium]